MRTSKLQNKCDMKISRSKVISFRETRENPTSLTCTHCSFRLHFWQILNVFKQYSLCWCLFHYLTNQNRSQEKITLTAEPTCCKQHCESKLFIANHFPFLSSFQPSPSGKLTNKNKKLLVTGPLFCCTCCGLSIHLPRFPISETCSFFS